MDGSIMTTRYGTGSGLNECSLSANVLQWNDGRRGQDGWGRYTRRRKWYRDAELVEISEVDDIEKSSAATATADPPPEYSRTAKDTDDTTSSQARRRGFFRRGSRASAQSSSDFSGTTTLRPEDDETHRLPSHQERNGHWEIGDDVKMGLG